jgi:hypothetical protein
MGTLIIAVGLFYAVAILVQVLSCAASLKKAKVSVEERTVPANLMTPQSV